MNRSDLRRSIRALERLAQKRGELPAVPRADEPVTPAALADYWACGFEAFGLDSIGRRLIVAGHPDVLAFSFAAVLAFDSEMGHGDDPDVILDVRSRWERAWPIAAVDPGRVDYSGHPSDAHEALVDGLILLASEWIRHAQGAPVTPVVGAVAQAPDTP